MLPEHEGALNQYMQRPWFAPPFFVSFNDPPLGAAQDTHPETCQDIPLDTPVHMPQETLPRDGAPGAIMPTELH